MKILITLALVCHACIAIAQTQTTSTFTYRPSFSAIVVKDVAISSQWYQPVFGLKVKSRLTDQNAGYDIYILESSNLTLELLQLKSSVAKKDALVGKPEQAEIIGLFKFGFTVPDMNACLNHLRTLKIDVPQIWTDDKTKKRNFLITDPDGNLIQFFEE